MQILTFDFEAQRYKKRSLSTSKTINTENQSGQTWSLEAVV